MDDTEMDLREVDGTDPRSYLVADIGINPHILLSE
jgi:hypothetical protein